MKLEDFPQVEKLRRRLKQIEEGFLLTEREDLMFVPTYITNAGMPRCIPGLTNSDIDSRRAVYLKLKENRAEILAKLVDLGVEP